MPFELGSALGPLHGRFLAVYGVVPFGVDGALDVCALVLVYTLNFETTDKGYRIEEKRMFGAVET